MRVHSRIFPFVFLLFMIAVVLPGCSDAGEADFATGDTMTRETVRIQKADGTEFPFFVEMAVTPSQQRVGLMNRTHMEANAGMLFSFAGEERQHVFWMKDTLIPLDMLFISKDGTVRHIHRMARPQDETRITSRMPVSAVLEINGGLSDRYGIKEGDKVLHNIFRNVLP